MMIDNEQGIGTNLKQDTDWYCKTDMDVNSKLRSNIQLACMIGIFITAVFMVLLQKSEVVQQFVLGFF